MNGKFDIKSNKKPVNKDITIVFSPSSNVQKYTYKIYKDDILQNSFDVFSSSASNIYLNKTGKYKVKVVLFLKNGQIENLESGYYNIDKEKPIINIVTDSNNKITCTAHDNIDGDITKKIQESKLNLKKSGAQKFTCTVQDEAGNIATNFTNINVVKPDATIYIIQMICFITALIFIKRIIHLFKVVKLEERLDSYTIKPLDKNQISTFEKISKIYQKIISSFSKKLEKSVIAKKQAQKLDKYTIVSPIYKNGFDIISGKIIIALAVTLLALFSKALQFKLLIPSEALLSFVLGFFILDIYLFTKYKFFRWRLESDFIAAITIMNNAFKSGRSITQAIDIVSTEVQGVIGSEFKRMSMELLYGLSVDTVFKRFAKRVDLEEASYLTASLTILNKTGGDIIKVFSSIERSMFDKRKLRLELKSLTSGSKIVVYVLLGIPFFFSLVISIINKDYLLPFINTNIGRCLLIFMIIYYIIFVVVVKKIMKVVIWWKMKKKSSKEFTEKKN